MQFIAVFLSYYKLTYRDTIRCLFFTLEINTRPTHPLYLLLLHHQEKNMCCNHFDFFPFVFSGGPRKVYGQYIKFNTVRNFLLQMLGNGASDETNTYFILFHLNVKLTSLTVSVILCKFMSNLIWKKIAFSNCFGKFFALFCRIFHHL